MRLLFILLLFAGSLPAAAQDSLPIEKLGDAGGATLAMLLSMYWLRESSQRRVDDAKAFAASVEQVYKLRVNDMEKFIDFAKEALNNGVRHQL